MEKPETEKASEELMRRDLGDIRTLRESESFNRYFLRRIMRKRDVLDKSFRDDPPAKVSHEEREILRRLIKSYDELLELCAPEEEGRILTQIKRATQ